MANYKSVNLLARLSSFYNQETGKRIDPKLYNRVLDHEEELRKYYEEHRSLKGFPVDYFDSKSLRLLEKTFNKIDTEYDLRQARIEKRKAKMAEKIKKSKLSRIKAKSIKKPVKKPRKIRKYLMKDPPETPLPTYPSALYESLGEGRYRRRQIGSDGLEIEDDRTLEFLD